MIQNIYGRESQLRVYFRRNFRPSESTLVVALPSDFSVPCGIARCLIPQLRTRLGEADVNRAIAQNKLAASLIFPALETRLNAKEKENRLRVIARLDSNMTHNEIAQRGLPDICATLLNNLLLAGDFKIIIPSIKLLDTTSLAILKSMYRLSPDDHPDLVIGLDRKFESPAKDKNGIRWHYHAGFLKSYALSFSSFSDYSELDIYNIEAFDDDVSNPPCCKHIVDSLDDDMEWKTFQALKLSHPPHGITRRAILSMQRAFECYSFKEAMQFGLELLQPKRSLSVRQKARVHGILALSAHNRQFLSRGNIRLGRFLHYHYQKALASESDPAIRICLLYRLAVTSSRRLKNLTAANRYSQQALCELNSCQIPLQSKILLTAWIRNVIGYIRVCEKDLATALVEETEAFDLLEQFQWPQAKDNAMGCEARLTKAIAADNAAQIVAMAKNNGARKKWHQIMEKAIEPWPEFLKYMTRAWANWYRENLRIINALAECSKGLHFAQEDLDVVMEYFYMVNLGDLHYRLGDASVSFKYFIDAIELRDRLEGAIEVRLPLEVSAAAAAMRLGNRKRAETYLYWLLDNRWNDVAHAQAEVWAQLATLAAQNGDAAETDLRMNRAIDLAVASGQRDLLLRVAIAAGCACRLLKRPQEALEAFTQALEIAEVQAGGKERHLAPPAADLVEALLGLCDSGCRDNELVLRALALFPTALAQDPESWWNLPRMLPLIPVVADRLNTTNKENIHVSIASVLIAATQRPDCSKGLENLNGHLPAELLATGLELSDTSGAIPTVGVWEPTVQ